MSKTIVIITGFAPKPTRQALDDLRALYPDMTFEVHVISWSNWNADELRATFHDVAIHFENFDEYKDDLTAVMQTFWINHRKIKPINSISMFRSWHFACALLDASDAEYAIKFRVDNNLLFSPTHSGLFDGFDGLTIPHSYEAFDGIMDQVCFGPKDYVRTYLDIYAHLETYAAAGAVLHPERLLRHHLQQHMPGKIRRTPLAVYLRDKLTSVAEFAARPEPERVLTLSGPEKWRLLANRKSYACREGVESPAEIRRRRWAYALRFEAFRFWRKMSGPFR